MNMNDRALHLSMVRHWRSDERVIYFTRIVIV